MPSIKSFALLSTSICLATSTAFAVDGEERGQAAEPPPNPMVHFDSAQFPSGGVIVGQVHGCYDCDDLPNQISLTDDEGLLELTGRFEFPDPSRPALFVFIPDSPLTPGNYLASVKSSFIGTTNSFEIVEATSDLPIVTHEVTLSRSRSGPPYSCEVYSTTAQEFTFYNSVLLEAQLTLNVSGPTASQFHYEVELDDEPPSQIFGLRNRSNLGSESEEVCYLVRGISYVDGIEETIADACVDPTTAGPLGITDEAFQHKEETLAGCIIPPEGFSDAWCEFFSSAISDESCENFDLSACMAARRTCPGGDLPYIDPSDPNFPFEAGDPNNPSGPSSNPGVDDPTEGSLDPDTGAQAGCGCRTGAPSSPEPHGTAWLIAGLVGLGLRNRKRRTL